MSSLLKIAAYFVGTLLLGALLAPPLFWAGHALGGHIPALHWLAETDFQRYFNRAMFLAALLLLWPAIRALHINGLHDLGLQPDPRPGWHAWLGFVLAAGLLWVLGCLLWKSGAYAPRKMASLPFSALQSSMLSAVFVSLVEEAFFRGALQGLIRRTARPWVALVSVAAIFAVLHFLKPPEGAIGLGEGKWQFYGLNETHSPLSEGGVGWLSGFMLLPKCFWQWSDPQLVLGGFLTLFAVGLVLGWARDRTQSLWLPIGLHAGWVFGLKTFSRVSKHVAEGNVLIGDDLLHGLAPVLMVLLTGGLAWLALKTYPGHPAARPESEPRTS